jgi:ATP-dependent Lon protease
MVEVPRRVRRDLNFVFVERMEEVLPIALLQEQATTGRRKPTRPDG